VSDATDPREVLRDLCFDAVTWIDVLGEGDAHTATREILDRVADTLRRDPGMPRLTRDGWDLLLADVRRQAAEDLARRIAGMGDVVAAIEAIVAAVLEHYRRRERSEEADAEADD